MNNKKKDIVVIVSIIVLALIITVTGMRNSKKEDVNMVVAVHVKGEVKKPGYYELNYGSRVKDAIDKAGGAAKNANLNGLNLAAKLRDGDEIIVPSKGRDASSDIIESGENAVNINTADVSLLCTLEGIGKETAEAIVAYRINNGGFETIEDLKNVDGIGKAKFDAIKDKIIV